MNSAITKGIAILLLIVAARDVEGAQRLVGTAPVRDSISAGKIGDINIVQPDTSQKRIEMQFDVPDMPEGNYVAVTHWKRCTVRDGCKSGYTQSYPDEHGVPRILFHAVSTAENPGIFTTVAVDDALKSYLENGIVFIVRIFKTNPGSIFNRTEDLVTYSFIPSALIAPDQIHV